MEPARTQCPKSTAVDRRVFQGIVDLDDEGSTDFSTQMVHTYLAVATSTLSDMDRAVRNKDIPKLSLLAASLQDTSVGIGVMEVLRSCSRLREVIRVWSETAENQTATERKAGAGSIDDGIIAAHEQLKADFVVAKSWLTRYAETGNVPEDSR